LSLLDEKSRQAKLDSHLEIAIAEETIAELFDPAAQLDE